MNNQARSVPRPPTPPLFFFVFVLLIGVNFFSLLSWPSLTSIMDNQQSQGREGGDDVIHVWQLKVRKHIPSWATSTLRCAGPGMGRPMWRILNWGSLTSGAIEETSLTRLSMTCWSHMGGGGEGRSDVEMHSRYPAWTLRSVRGYTVDSELNNMAYSSKEGTSFMVSRRVWRWGKTVKIFSWGREEFRHSQQRKFNGEDGGSKVLESKITWGLSQFGSKLRSEGKGGKLIEEWTPWNSTYKNCILIQCCRHFSTRGL